MSLKEDIEELARLKGKPVYMLSKELGMSASTLSSHVKNPARRMHHYTLNIIKHELHEARLKEFNRLKLILGAT